MHSPKSTEIKIQQRNDSPDNAICVSESPSSPRKCAPLKPVNPTVNPPIVYTHTRPGGKYVITGAPKIGFSTPAIKPR